VQVLRLISKMNKESKRDGESTTRNQLREQIAVLSQPRVGRATDVLVMIWNAMKEPLEPAVMEPKLTFWATPALPRRVKLALLKSIYTGTFIDVQFYAYNEIDNGLPLDPRPLFTSSVVIEKWGPTITTRKWEYFS